MDKPLIGAELKQIDKSHRGYLNHWVDGLMHINVQTRYDIQYLTMQLSGYMNASTEPACLDLNMAWNTSCTTRMNPSYTQERKFIKLKRVTINVTSNQEMKNQKN